jgi:hypothetical protein
LYGLLSFAKRVAVDAEQRAAHGPRVGDQSGAIFASSGANPAMNASSGSRTSAW